VEVRGDRLAFGGPGMAPKWSHSNKDGVGTAYSADSRLWYTLWRGIVTEVYFPTLDRPQLRDLELLFTDGSSFFHEEKRDLTSRTERIGEHSLAYRVRSEEPEGRYRLRKTVLSDPHLPCLLSRVRVEVPPPGLDNRLRAFVLAAPHLNVGGWGNTASVQRLPGRTVLLAEKDDVAAAIGATLPFLRSSVGYVGASDGWTDLNAHRQLTWEFDQAPDGNVALTGEIPVHDGVTEFTLGLAFGESAAAAVTTLLQSLGTPFELHERRFRTQWRRTSRAEEDSPSLASDGGALYRASRSLLLAHEDKTYPGAFIASLSIPWGASRGDEDRGGYHLVWVRDLYHAATGLLAAGEPEAALRALIYLASRQQPDGGFPQNFWIDGRPYWRGLQLDEVALPILLAAALHRAGALREFDPTPMVYAAARFLVQHGPVTQQDRWEEVSGYSPSTLASSIAALTCAASFARRVGDEDGAAFVQEHADFLESHLETWTTTRAGPAGTNVPRHFVRIRPAAVGDPTPHEGPELGRVHLPNLPPGAPADFPAAEVVDAGFLDLVRLGVRAPEDPLIVESLRVVDDLLKVDTPLGPVWRRYNHDGYGTRDDGSAYDGWGVGRAWPLLTGERGHYELAAGRDPAVYLRAMEDFATPTGLLPEQVWDGEDHPALHLTRGHLTESAVPLVWAHAEYIKLLRSAAEGRVYDQLLEVVQRYQDPGRAHRPLEVWKFNRQPAIIPRGAELRIVADQPFRLRASRDAWSSSTDRPSVETRFGLHFVDLPALARAGEAWQFTFHWPINDRWEGRNYTVTAVA